MDQLKRINLRSDITSHVRNRGRLHYRRYPDWHLTKWRPVGDAEKSNHSSFFWERFQSSAANDGDNMLELFDIHGVTGVDIMKLRNNVGGFRIYPTSPVDAEISIMAAGVIGQFNEGMDRLHRERELTQQQLQFVNQRPSPNSQLARCYRVLNAYSNRFWQLALEKQQYLNQGIVNGPYTTKELGKLLIQSADLWQELKHRLDEQTRPQSSY